jgi:hypothetical protein
MRTIHNNKIVVNPLYIDKTHSWNKMHDDIKMNSSRTKKCEEFSLLGCNAVWY